MNDTVVSSWFDEVDRCNRSGPNPPTSNAAECLHSCELNIQASLNDRREVYRRWQDIVQRDGVYLYVMDRDDRPTKKIRTNKYGERLYTKDGAVLFNDVMRAEAEVKHWREMAEWWGAKAAEDPHKVRVFEWKEVA